MIIAKKTSFDNVFDFSKDDLSQLEIVENSERNNCLIRHKVSRQFYNAFILYGNTQTDVICEISFFPSSFTGKYLPRPVFRKTNKVGETKENVGLKPVIIPFSKSEEANALWTLIAFLNSFKSIVDLGEFEKSYQVHSKNTYFIEFQNKDDREKILDLKELILTTDLTENDIKSMVFENREKTLKTFLWLLKDLPYQENINSLEAYRLKYDLPPGQESIWHHFLKHNDWILGLNVDIKFIIDFYDEQKVGLENSKGQGSPKVDLMGTSEYTTLIELKHSNTRIFKSDKSKARANTWDFTSDFIEGLSQCLGQKNSLESSFSSKNFVNESGMRLDKSKIFTRDPKCIFIIGNRRDEFPHDSVDEHIVKSQTFELLRRNSRNIDIITFDELFERAYHIIYNEKLNDNWFDHPDMVFAK